jgi:hypothetical protein
MDIMSRIEEKKRHGSNAYSSCILFSEKENQNTAGSVNFYRRCKAMDTEALFRLKGWGQAGRR